MTRTLMAALAALAISFATVTAQAADAPVKPAAKAHVDSAGTAKTHYYVMKCKTDACRAKHPTGKYYVPIKPKKS